LGFGKQTRILGGNMIIISVIARNESCGVSISHENEEFIIYMGSMIPQAYEYGKFLNTVIPDSKIIWKVLIETREQEVSEEVWKAWSL
jgi:hypothetical protein